MKRKKTRKRNIRKNPKLYYKNNYNRTLWRLATVRRLQAKKRRRVKCCRIRSKAASPEVPSIKRRTVCNHILWKVVFAMLEFKITAC